MSNPVRWKDETQDDARKDWASSVPYVEDASTTDTHTSRVTRNEGVWGGMATVAGSRVPVFMVADLEAEGETVRDICGRYPHLTPADIYAALSYAHAFDGIIAQERARYQEAIEKYRP